MPSTLELEAPSPGLPSGPQSGLPSINQAREAGERGMTLALEKAERQEPQWSTLALNYLKQYAAREPRFTAFMVVATAAMDKTFPSPENSKAWGKVFMKAAEIGVIRKTDDYMPHPKRHGCPAVVWRSLIYDDIGVIGDIKEFVV